MRLVFVTRRFWPLFGDAENAIENLSVGLRQFGCDSTILTARWDRSWSERFAYRGIPVIRLPNPMLPGWGRMRYRSSLGNWLREHQDTYDLVCVSRMR